MLRLVYVIGQARYEAAERAAAEARRAAGVTPERCRAAVKSLADEALGWVGWSGLYGCACCWPATLRLWAWAAAVI
jgi:hypothetical protein